MQEKLIVTARGRHFWGYGQLALGIGICLYAVGFFVFHLQNPHYVELIFFNLIGVFVIRQSIKSISNKATWTQNAYDQYVDEHKAARDKLGKSRIAFFLGWAFIMLGVFWVYISSRYLHLSDFLTYTVEALIALPGFALIIYRSIVTGLIEYRSIRRFRERGN